MHTRPSGVYNVFNLQRNNLKQSNSMLKRVRDIDWKNPKYIRAGIIPIIDQGNVRFFGFGVENGVAAIGDFGGHKEKKDYDALDSAIREYKEEALNVFGELNREMLQDYYVLDGTDTIEILLPVLGPLTQYNEAFRKLLGNNDQHEIQSIIWFSKHQLLEAVDSQAQVFDGVKIYHMYYRIVDTINLNRSNI